MNPLAFIEAYRRAPDDADIEIRTGGLPGLGTTHVLCSIDGEYFAFTPEHARKVALCFESALYAFPSAREASGIANVVMGLRAAADKCGSHP